MWGSDEERDIPLAPLPSSSVDAVNALPENNLAPSQHTLDGTYLYDKEDKDSPLDVVVPSDSAHLIFGTFSTKNLEKSPNKLLPLEDSITIKRETDQPTIKQTNNYPNSSTKENISAVQSAATAIVHQQIHWATESHQHKKDNRSAVLRKEDWGWCVYDAATTPFLTTIQMSFLPTYLTLTVQQFTLSSPTAAIQPFNINAQAFYSYCLSFSVLVQIILSILFGALADFGSYRKFMLMCTSIVGSITVIFFLFLVPGPNYWYGGALLIISNVMYGLSIVYYNSFLPYLVKSHPNYRPVELVDPQMAKDAAKGNELIATTISNYGTMLGFGASVFILSINTVIFLTLPESCKPQCTSCPACDRSICGSHWNPNNCDPDFWGYRINIALVGVWWLSLSIFAFLWLESRQGLEFPGKHFFLVGLSSMYNNFKQIRQLPETFRFIIAFWIYGDGMATIAFGAPLLASQLLDISSWLLAVCMLAYVVAAPIGNYLFLTLHRKFPFWQPKRIVILNLCIVTVIPLWSFKMSTAAEFFIAVFILGFSNASLQSFSRVILASLIPSGKEAQFYSLYSISDRSSWLGPLLIAVIIDMTSSVRMGIVAIVVLFCIGLGILLSVDLPRGYNDVNNFADKPQPAPIFRGFMGNNPSGTTT